MTITLSRRRGADDAQQRTDSRYRLSRAGVLNVWQYDDQVFGFADGRLLLRGANGAGKSKTLEMLLPFVLDGDRTRITASARHHTSLLWLMTDGYDGQARTGYLWLELTRRAGDRTETYTCGVGIRASASARTATAWFFATDRRVGVDLALEDDGGPLSRGRLVEAIGDRGQVFEQARAYKEHVGRTLFGLAADQYDDVLRLLYWLRQPQVGEDIEPARLAGQLAQALPQLDEQAVRAAGDTFDELAAYGEQIERRSAAAEALASLAAAYAGYARGVVAGRGRAVVAAATEAKRLLAGLRRAEVAYDELTRTVQAAQGERSSAEEAERRDRAAIRELEAGPEARDQRRLGELADLVRERQESATTAERQAGQQGERLAAREEALSRESAELVRRSGQQAGRTVEIRSGLADAGVDAAFVAPVRLGVETLETAEQAEAMAAGVDEHATAQERAAAALTARQAVVGVVRAAATAHEEAARDARHEERRAAEAEERWEAATKRRAQAQGDADTAEAGLRADLGTWAAQETAAAVAVPAELTPEVLAALPRLAAEAAAPLLAALREEERSESATRDLAGREADDLLLRRAAIEAERDPSPPAPALRRTPRPDGAALWRLVDFAPGVAAADRAALEAALQASGLLDAWVRPDGALLDAGSLDVVLAGGPPVPGPTLADVLVADCPEGGAVAADRVTSVLRRVGHGARDDDAAWVGGDGSWRLGPMHGRAAKEVAQYVGATARAGERRRRLDEVDAALTLARARHDRAATRCAELASRIADLEAWLRARPSTQALSRAWDRLELRTEEVTRDEAANAAAQQAAHAARDLVATRQRELAGLAQQHAVPVDRSAIDALTERLRALSDALREIGRELPGLRRDLDRYARRRRELDADAEEVAAARGEAARIRSGAEQAESAYTALQESVGASVQDLQRRLSALHASVTEQQGRARSATDRMLALEKSRGQAERDVEHARAALDAHRAVRSEALAGLVALTDPPGLVAAALGPVDADHAELHADVGVLEQARGIGPDDPLPRALLGTVARMAGLDVAAAAGPNAVWQSYNEATSGPAADHEPRVLSVGDLLAVTARDDAGEDPVVVLAPRAAARVAQDRELLTERERDQFEQHVLGELGDAIRRCRVEADELVHAMNDLLAGVTTSQGIRVRLDWRLRDDVPPEAATAVKLLTQPLGALLPEERVVLRDSLHRLIEAGRADDPGVSYAESLVKALDYRSWFAFRIRYTRPESPGAWLDLHRRSPLSQGEQKVLCYLPLFAAAAAHFTSLAGAAPYAPRLVLLDDAFPKIDVRTHPLLFGLLVQLDLDFVVTSERLWGDHDTVPSLAIYEALRDPSQRGIAQYEYRWDGRQLRSV
jgi:uncharacterized protein (TIGR02680 family)